MSDASEVKRWKITAAQWDNPKSEWRFKDSVGPGFDGYDSPSPTIEVMPVIDHDRIVAELRSEVAQAKREAADAMSGCCDCPMFKAQGKTVARQARVIEKLREQRERYAKDMQEVCGTPNLYKRDEQELEAIEQGEGT